ncbi:MAG: sialidase family protein [Anaerolineae bacterium]
MRLRKWAVVALAAALLALSVIAVEAATKSFDRQANNPQVAPIPGSNTSAVFPTNKQNETTIAVNPTNANILLSGANDEQQQPPCGPGPVRGATAPANDCSFFPDVGTSGVYRTTDGGSTWKNLGLLDDQAGWKASALVSDGDPVIVYGPKPTANGGFSYANGARAYYATLASYKTGQSPYPDQKAPELIAVSYSDDNGTTWSAPVIAAVKSNPNNFNDKESIWADRNPNSPYFGRVYVGWTQFRSATVTGNGNAPVLVAISADGGASFGSPKQLSSACNNGTGCGRQGSAIRTGPDGSVYVAWEEANQQIVSISRDGGAKWTTASPIGPVTDIADPIPGASFRTDSFLSLGVDQTKGTVYAAWANRTADGGRIVVATSSDRGQTWGTPVTVSTAGEGYAFFQGLDVAPNGRVDVGYQALKASNPDAFGTGNAAVNAWYVSKPAGGAWSAPVKVSSASSDPAATAQNNLALQFWGDYNTLVSTNSKAWFSYTDARNGVGCPAVDAYQKDPANVAKPAPGQVCPSQFGNSDDYVSVITP